MARRGQCVVNTRVTTLIQAPVRSLLDQLFSESEFSKTSFVQEMGALTVEQRRALQDTTDPLALYARAERVHLAASRQTCTLLYLLARSSNAHFVVEYGASFGVSTLHLAAAVKDNGGGRVISSEFVSSKIVRARDNLNKANLLEFVEIREGDARMTLARNLPTTVDLVFLDGAKQYYPHILSLLEPRLRPGGVVVADNIEGSPEYCQRVRSSPQYLSLPFSEGVEVSLWLGESPPTDERPSR
jgi:predicted O-methyltransferase YrrM